jgi:septal ring-binding cell division protein DamX|tara:strand:- start:1502 stop:2224 length:723 start_codon:yes stop_codon:yes gene_type:complete
VIESAATFTNEQSSSDKYMNGWIRSGFMVQVLLLVSSCSLLGNLGFGSKKECADGICETPQILHNQQLKQNWHCYGVAKDRSWDCVSEPQPEKIATFLPAPSPKPVLAAETLVTESLLTAAPKEAEVEVDVNPTPDPAENDDSASTILGKPGDYYTVQLIALQKKGQILEYASQNGLDDLLYTQIESKGSNWFVLLLGFYPDQSSAEKARQEFVGTRTLKVRPWIRKLAPLQEAIMSSQR